MDIKLSFISKAQKRRREIQRTSETDYEKAIMRILAIFNQKGGCGKTTTSVNLASSLAELEKKVLLVDLDPQCSSSKWLNLSSSSIQESVITTYINQDPVRNILFPTKFANLSMIPSSIRIKTATKNPTNAPKNVQSIFLKKQLSLLDEGKFDFIVIDCPPDLGKLTLAALLAATELIVPVPTNYMGISVLAEVFKVFKAVHLNYNPNILFTGILCSQYNGNKKHDREVLSAIFRKFKNKVFDTVIREDEKLTECPSFFQPINHYAPQSVAAQDFRSFSLELLKY
ncbi:MAG: ParA family protein [Leptospiraceae bacterium]|nr:ParA family protein [Leptospiraceae bacterium]